MTRVKKIEEKVLNKLWENGGHWVELKMKTGDKLYIQRQNFERYEDLHKEKFNVSVNGKKALTEVKLDELATFINKNY